MKIINRKELAKLLKSLFSKKKAKQKKYWSSNIDGLACNDEIK